MLATLIDMLCQRGVEPSAEDVADIYWLAIRMSYVEQPEMQLLPLDEDIPIELPLVDDLESADLPIEMPPEESSVPIEQELAPPAPSEPIEVPIHGYTPPTSSLMPASGDRLPIALSTVTALPGQLDLARALRPLMRRSLSRHQHEIDEAASAQYIAESKIWMPVLRPRLERWLDVTLVVDRAPSMFIWQQTIDEWRQLLEHHGAFRDVRVWSIDTGSRERVRLLAGWTDRQGAERSAKELVDPTRRRLILVFSDCMAAAWQSGAAQSLLYTWGSSTHVALVQPLPTRLWHRTTLGRYEVGTITAAQPGSSNAHLTLTLSEDNPDVQDVQLALTQPANRDIQLTFASPPAPPGMPMSILTLEPKSLHAWAAMIAHANQDSSGIYLTTENKQAQNPESSLQPDVSIEERIQDFRRFASPRAWRLVQALSAAPLSLPVMRLVHTMVDPKPRLDHMAEVVLGGLFKRSSNEADQAAFDTVQYEFYPGVREKLLHMLTVPKQYALLHQISTFLQAREGHAHGFRALLVSPNIADYEQLQVANPAFAHIAIKVLRAMGGSYAQLAQKYEELGNIVLPSTGTSPTTSSNEGSDYVTALAEQQVGQCTIRIVLADLLKLPVDAIAITRRRSMQAHQAGGYTIHGQIQAIIGAKIIDEEAEREGELELGGIRVTGAGPLPARYVIHTGIIDDIDNTRTTQAVLERAVRAIFAECERRGWRSVALPLMGGAGGISLEACIEVYLAEALAHARQTISPLQIHFVFIREEPIVGYARDRFQQLAIAPPVPPRRAQPIPPISRPTVPEPLPEPSARGGRGGLPTLIIGVGGTGLRVLQRVKERLLETYYGEVPSQITLLEFDTALQSPADNFAGVQLAQDTAMYSSSAVQQEMQLIQTNPSFTMEQAMAEARQGVPRWNWLEVDKLDRLLPPNARAILEGAGAFRPVGRTAFFLNYKAIAEKLRMAMQQVLNPIEVGNIADVTDVTKAKCNVFLVGSFAGGTGSGGFIDLAALMRNIKQFDTSFNGITLIGIIVLPRFYANIQDELGRRVPNTYAGLRELDRFMRAHTSGTSYTYVGGHGEEIPLNNQLLDLCYLVDVEDYAGRPAGLRPDLGGIPAIADMIVAHTDLRLGLRLNATNINVAANYAFPQANQAQPSGATQQYTYQSRRYYSALNCHTVIFPREDIAKSLSLRFLSDFIDSHMISRDQRGQLIVPTDPLPVNELVEFLAKPNPTIQERMAALGGGKEHDFKLGIFVQMMLQYANRRFDTEPENVMTWLVEDAHKRKVSLEVIRRSIDETIKNPADPTNMNSFIGKVRNWLDKYLGPPVHPNNLFGDREGGAWEKELGNLVTEQRQQMESYVQRMVLSILNQRQVVTFGEEKTSVIRANRLSYVLAILRKLKDRVRAFIKQADLSFGTTAKNLDQLRRDLDDHRAKVAAFRGPIVPLFNPNPGPVYLRKLHEVAEAERHRLLRNLAVEMASQFGGDIASEGRSQSVLDTVIQEIESWVKGLGKVREIIEQERRRHEARRKEKYAIGVRSYITDPQKFPKAAEVEEELYQRYKPIVLRTLVGPDPMGTGGAFLWETHTNSYFDYQITTKMKLFKLHPYRTPEAFGLFGKASGVEEISREWQAGGFRLMAEQIRSDKLARVAYYLSRLYPDQRAMFNSVIMPNSKALVKLQGVQPNDRQRELYLAIDPTSDDMKVSDFFSWFGQKWKSTEQNQDFLQSESDLSCTFLTLYHGLELDQFNDFNASERSYRAMERQQGCLHLFPEERLAADYEAQIPTLGRNDWESLRRLHPEVVIGLRDSKHVRSFAHALVCGLIEDTNDGIPRELYLCLPDGLRQLLTNSRIINNHSEMGPNDQSSARLLQAFHTYTLLGKPINDQYGYDTIDYGAVEVAFERWFGEEHKGKTGAEIEQLLKAWETDPNGMIAPLFRSEGKDPRFRDLGIVLMLELIRWRQLFR